MADNETIADLVAEIRALSNPISDGIIAINGKSIADRLEAAWKRERAKIEADALEVGGIVEAAQKRERGDCAKLREALDELVANIEMRSSTFGLNAIVDTKTYLDAKAALASPPRNCDKYATADEALKAQEQMFNDSNFANGECKLGCPECDNPRVGCKIAWLFAPATEKEGGDK